MKKLSKKQIVLIVIAIVCTIMFFYISIKLIKSLDAFITQYGYYKEYTPDTFNVTQEQFNSMKASHLKNTIDTFVYLFALIIMYFCFMWLATVEFLKIKNQTTSPPPGPSL